MQPRREKRQWKIRDTCSEANLSRALRSLVYTRSTKLRGTGVWKAQRATAALTSRVRVEAFSECSGGVESAGV
jgi:hypothetical protein